VDSPPRVVHGFFACHWCTAIEYRHTLLQVEVAPGHVFHSTMHSLAEATRMSFKLTRGDALPWRLTALSLRTIATVVYAQPRRALPTELHDPHHKIRRGPGCRGSVRRVVPVRVDSAELESGDTQGSPWPVLEQTVTFACPARAPCILPASALRCVHEPGRCLL